MQSCMTCRTPFDPDRLECASVERVDAACFLHYHIKESVIYKNMRFCIRTKARSTESTSRSCCFRGTAQQRNTTYTAEPHQTALNPDGLRCASVERVYIANTLRKK